MLSPPPASLSGSHVGAWSPEGSQWLSVVEGLRCNHGACTSGSPRPSPRSWCPRGGQRDPEQLSGPPSPGDICAQAKEMFLRLCYG